MAADATGAWSGQDGSLACFSEGGWSFISPVEGMCLFDQASGEPMQRRSGEWERGILRAQEVRVGGQTVLRDRQPAITNPSGGSLIDGECRLAVAEILGAMRAHGLID